MGISFQCDACGKQYKVADALAGKRGKCKECGAVIQVPQIEPPAEELTDLSALAEIERTGVVMPEPAEAAAARSRRVPPAPALNYATPTDYDSSPTIPFQPARKKSREPHPFHVVIDSWLPIGLILVGYGFPLIMSLIDDARSDSPGLSLLLTAAFVVVVLLVVVRVTVLGLKLASHYMEFELAESPGFRVMAAFAAGPLTAAIFTEMAVLASATLPSAIQRMYVIFFWLIVGMIIGIFISFFLLWLLFGLRFKEAVVAWLLAALGNFIGSIIALAVYLGIVVLIFRAKGSIDEAMGNKPANSSPGVSNPVIIGNPIPQPVPGVVFTPISPAEQKRRKSIANLYSISSALYQYAQTHAKHYPRTMDDLKAYNRSAALYLQSPFNPSPGGIDYDLEPDTDQTMVANTPGQWVIAYDKSEVSVDDHVCVLTTVGPDEYTTSEFQTMLAASQAAVEEFKQAQIKKKQDALAAAAAQATPTPPQLNLPPRRVIPEQPVEPVAPAEPTGWSATVDALPKPLQFKEDFHWFTPKTFRANDLLYSATAGTAVAAGMDFENGSNGADDVHEAWDLRSVARIGRIVGPLPLKHAVLSADGQYIAGTTSGGPGQATVFEMWSFRTGRKAQTFAAPPVQGNLAPMAIGFDGPDSLLTVGDALMLWDFKSGALTRQIELKTPRNPEDQYALSATGKLLAILDPNDRVDLYDLEAGKYLGYNQPDLGRNRMGGRFRNNQHDIAFSPDGTELAVYLPQAIENHVTVFSTSTGKQLADLKVQMPAGMMNMNRKQSEITWLPDGSGWLLDSAQIVDRQTGIILCPVAGQQIVNAEEYGPRTVISDKTVIMSFKSSTDQVAIGTYPLPADVIAKTRAVVRGTTTSPAAVTPPAATPPGNATPADGAPPADNAIPSGVAPAPDGAQN
jgi:hypothetical protein